MGQLANRKLTIQSSSTSDMQLAMLKNVETAEDTADRMLEITNWTVSHYFSHDRKPCENSIRNQKYSMLTFIPKVLYQQFKYFFNLFYLLTALSQFVPALKVGLMFSFVAPLLLVLTLTMLKQAYEDYQRYLKDRQINSATYTIIDKGSACNIKRAWKLEVGDIIEVATGDSIPADCLFLKSLTDKHSLFIKTDQLDGETDWKLRKPVLVKGEPEQFCIEFADPTHQIYDFIGCARLQQGKIGLGLQNSLWRGVKIASGKALLLVIYTGKQTKLSLNMKQPQNKFGKLDSELNFFSKLLFVIMMLLSGILILLRGLYGDTADLFIVFFKYFLLLSSIIPISMRVNLDFAKLLYKFQIDRDTMMENCLCRNSNIPEELGRIQYILSDKTGTLTQNQMVFKKLFISEQAKYEADQLDTIKQMLIKEQGGQTEQSVANIILGLMLCHNVTPVEDNGMPTLQGSSPDELTLVRFGQSLGYKLRQRTEDYIQLQNLKREIYSYDILELFPFTSESKSMGIIVRNRVSKQITLYLKGADSVMQSKIPQLDSRFMFEACLDLAREGLRTLVIAQKHLNLEYYENWKKQFTRASSAMKQREERINQCRRKLQHNMEFLGVTGVEDKLQEGVVQTIGSARSIGMKVWMLTGDKIETAICVARAVRLIQSKEESLFVIEGMKCKTEFLLRLEMFYIALKQDKSSILNRKTVPSVLVIDGQSLKYALAEIQEQFFNLAIRLPAIICSRVSPTQKAEIASMVIKYNSNNGRVLGIGDGGNDVALIQSAHVGVGIYGKQGIQAALASDFSISKFSELNSLIFWHGRLAYKRSSLLAQFIIHRGVIITIMQCIFIIEFYFVPLPIYNGFLLLGYSTIFTMLPVFSLILDEDISRSLAMQYPILYKNTQQGNQVSIRSFTYWLFISIYQGSIIMILITAIIISQSFYMVTTVSFTCLIFIEFLNVFTQLHRIHIAQIVSMLISMMIYIGSIFLMKSNLNGVQLFTTTCLPVTCLIVIVAWLPPFSFEKLKRMMNPTQEQKLMKREQVRSSFQLIY